MIAPETIRQVQQAADIIEVVGDFVSLKKRGSNYIACCPFHDEKTPSFSVSQSKGIYKCFGCGKAGDAITFIREIEGISYVEAIRFLAQKYHIEIVEDKQNPEAQKAQTEKESLLIALQFANQYFQQTLKDHPDGQIIGHSYFKERGFRENTIKKFELGYSISEWDGFLKQATQNQFQTDILEKAGLILKNEKTGNFYDRFRGRVMFPIHNTSGKTIAFGARILIKDKNQPKYINSPESEVYHKSDVLYGIFQAKNKIRENDECFLVEGYTDVISMHQAGVENVVASSGTSLTENQIKLIQRFTLNVTVLYDGDAAGIKASLRGIDMILEAGLNVRVSLFPDGHDPDSYIQSFGSEAFATYLKEKRQDFITFKTQLFLEDAEKDPIKKAELIRDISQSISKVQDPIQRSVFFQQCSKLLGINEAVLIGEYNKTKIKERQDVKDALADQPADLPLDGPISPVFTLEDSIALQEKEYLRLLINHAMVPVAEDQPFYAYLMQEVQDVSFRTPKYVRLLTLFQEAIQKQLIPNLDYFKSLGDEVVLNDVIELTSHRFELSENWEKFQILAPTLDKNLPESAASNLYRLKLRNIQLLLKEKQEELKETKDEEKIMELLRMCKLLKETEMVLAKELGIVVNK